MPQQEEDMEEREAWRTEMSQKIDLILGALMGNSISQDGGLVGKVSRQEDRIGKMEDKQDKHEDLMRKWQWMGLAIVTSTPIIVTILVFIFQQLGKLK